MNADFGALFIEDVCDVGTLVTGVAGYVGYQLLPGQRPYVLAAAAVAILGWILAPTEGSDRQPLPRRHQRP